jgi:hypothetical protein
MKSTPAKIDEAGVAGEMRESRRDVVRFKVRLILHLDLVHA